MEYDANLVHRNIPVTLDTGASVGDGCVSLAYASSGGVVVDGCSGAVYSQASGGQLSQPCSSVSTDAQQVYPINMSLCASTGPVI